MPSFGGEKSASTCKEAEALLRCEYVDDTLPQYSDVALLSSPSQKLPSAVAGRSAIRKQLCVLSLILALIGFVGLAVASFITYGRYSAQFASSAHNLIQTKVKFRGTDGVYMEQHLSSSVVGSYVTYHVIQPNHQQLWIVDDFVAGVQAMKIETPDETICYATYLNRSLSPLPEAYFPSSDNKLKSTDKLVRVQTVFMASETPMTDIKLLGGHALDLCFDVPIYWVSPVTIDSTALHSDDPSHQQQLSGGGGGGGGGREKRNVKKCLESCCYLVCCCNQRYLQWQSEDSFNCKHICSGCTPKSSTNIRQMC